MCKFYASILAAILLPTLVSAQAPSPQIGERTPAAAGVPSVQSPPDKSDSISPEIVSQLTAIRAAITKISDKESKTDYTPLKFSLAGTLGGVIIGGLVTFLVQRRVLANQIKLAQDAAATSKELANSKAAQDKQLARDRASWEVGAAIIQWRLKQLSELYGPLHTLLQQSNQLYRHMNVVLAKSQPDKFRLRDDEQADDFDKKIFEIDLDGSWIRFRTVLHLAGVYGHGHGIEDYFDEVVLIGARIVKVIHEKAGFVRPEQSDLVIVFGKYLAHYSVLEGVHAPLKAWHDSMVQGDGKTKPPALPNVDTSAAFPWQIQRLVEIGFEDIGTELSAWQARQQVTG